MFMVMSLFLMSKIFLNAIIYTTKYLKVIRFAISYSFHIVIINVFIGESIIGIMKLESFFISLNLKGIKSGDITIMLMNPDAGYHID